VRWATALLCWLLGSLPAIAGQPDRFGLDDAYREAPSPQRLRISLNGLWRFQPAQDVLATAPPTGGGTWAWLKVPGRWNPDNVAYGGFVPKNDKGESILDWNGIALGDITSAWYQREVSIPKECDGRRILLRFEHLGAGVDERISFYLVANGQDESLKRNAAVFVNGQRVTPEDDWTVDITASARSAAANTLTVGVKSRDHSRWGRGLNGDVWLECEPRLRIVDFDWSSSYADRRLAVHATVANDTETSAEVRLRAILDGKAVGDSVVAPVAARGTAELSVSAAVPALAAWSEFDPHLTELRLELVENTSSVDVLPAKIAMRDMHFVDGELMLNGHPVALRTESGPTLGYGMEVFDREFMRNYVSAYRAAHYNGFRSLWGRVPDYVYELTDQMGMMVQLILPSPAMFRSRSGINDDAQFWPAYRTALAKQIARTKRHVSVVAYDLWTHEVADRMQNQPDRIGGDWAPTLHLHDRERAEILKAVELLKQIDPSREVLLDESNSLGKMVDVHPYFDFSVPLQEWEDWPERRGAKPIKPLNASEFGLPYIGSWTEWDPTSWEAGGASAFIIENAARYLGDQAYALSRSAMLPRDWELRGAGYVANTAVDPGLTANEGAVTRYQPNIAADEVASLFATRVYRAWRTARVNLGPFAQDTMAGAGMLFRPVDGTFPPVEGVLKSPGPKPDRVFRNAGGYAATALPVASSDAARAGQPAFQPTITFAATAAAFEPVLVYLGGDSELGTTSKDHAFWSGEEIKKSVVVVNDGSSDLDVIAHWTLGPTDGAKTLASGSVTISARRGRSTIVPLRLSAPAASERTAFRLSIVASAGGKDIGKDAFDLQVFPEKLAPAAIEPGRRIGLYDKTGDTARVLDAMGVTYRRVDRLDDHLDLDLLVIGALSLDSSARALAPLIEKGLNVLELEQILGAPTELAAQTGAIRDTTYLAATAARIVFPSDRQHPILAGLEPADFADWRGSSDLLQPYAPASETSYLARVGGVEKFRGSNRGIVSSFVIPKPQRGNFRTILSAGFDMGQTPLVEFYRGRGRLLVSQLDATARYGKDPVATRLLRNAVAYMAKPSPAWKRTGYIGDERGATLLKSLGAGMQDAAAGFPANLANFDIVIAGDGGDRALKANRDAVIAWIKQGGQLILCDDVLARIDPDWFVELLSTEQTHFYKGLFADGEPLLRGIAQADGYIRAGVQFTRVASRRDMSDATLVYIIHLGAGTIATLPVSSTLPLPVLRKRDSDRVTVAADKLSRVTAEVLTNAGMALETPLALYPEEIDLTGAWRFKTDPEDRGAAAGWARADFDDGAWRMIDIPGLWAFQGVTEAPTKGGVGYDGVAWYRRTVAIPASWREDAAALSLVVGGIADTGDIYWNGALIAHGAERSYIRDQTVISLDPASIPYGGKATIAIRVKDNGPAGGVTGTVAIRKDSRWLTGVSPVIRGEKFPDFQPDSYHYW
jgi:beta-galactosidase/beta-glucuronidase